MNRIIEGAKSIVEDKSGMEFESDIDRAIFEIYGKVRLEEFNNLYKSHPDWTPEQVIRYFEAHPVNTQTNFFRTGNIKVIAEQLSSKIKFRESGEQIRILEVGCSSGEESYSLAVEMLEAGYKNFQITAVDVDPEMLHIAQKGEYKMDSAVGESNLHYSNLKPKHFANGYFENPGKTWEEKVYIGPPLSDLKKMGYGGPFGKKVGEFPREWYTTIKQPVIQPTKKTRERVVFVSHDLIDKPAEGNFSIVLMNNVLNHYPQETREKIVKNALSSLRPGGFLVLEHTMRPRTEGEEDWLVPYNKWRDEFAEKFDLEEVAVKVWYGGDEYRKTGQYYQYKPKKIYV